MAKEFVRNIKNTTVNEPLNTNEQNDLLSDTQHIYIRNKNTYYPLTKGLIDIVPESGSIIQTEKIIDGTENNRVVIKNNLENLKSVINSIIDTPDFTLTAEMINDFLSVTDGLVKSIKDGKIELKPKTPISEITGDIDQQTEKINTLQEDMENLYLRNAISDVKGNYPIKANLETTGPEELHARIGLNPDFLSERVTSDSLKIKKANTNGISIELPGDINKPLSGGNGINIAEYTNASQVSVDPSDFMNNVLFSNNDFDYSITSNKLNIKPSTALKNSLKTDNIEIYEAPSLRKWNTDTYLTKFEEGLSNNKLVLLRFNNKIYYPIGRGKDFVHLMTIGVETGWELFILFIIEGEHPQAYKASLSAEPIDPKEDL